MKSRIILRHTICYSSQSSNIIFSNKLFHFSYKLLSPPSEKKTTFLWGFCRVFVIFFQYCFMSETQLLMTESDFFGFFSRNHFLEGAFTFQLEGGFIFKSVFVGRGGAPWEHQLWWGGVGVKKIMETSHAPHYRKPYIVRPGN